MLPVSRLVGATDFSIAGFPAVVTAGELAAHFGAELLLVHVLAPPPMPPMVPPERMATLPSSTEIDKYERDSERQSRQDLERLVAEKLPPGLACRTVVLVGAAAEAIVNVAEQEAGPGRALADSGVGRLPAVAGRERLPVTSSSTRCCDSHAGSRRPT
jgi:nucleotide-binding universal stress UspA family protein